MNRVFYIDKYKHELRTNWPINKGLMETSIRNLKRSLKEVDEEITLEMAVDWLTASKMFTDEEIKDFIENFEKHD